ncbi:hypothetical protein [Pandoraea sputorum]|uniref:Transmembrane protein n=1 Tax=Pandoraea sputorum TaxID=93222 RepID=A0A5E5AVN1_9BURK|nr:hypothetical protein [Pandoraea sputorum]VVE77619.1 hypothetical protein PSP31121_01194 [Pandoraea sputorum]
MSPVDFLKCARRWMPLLGAVVFGFFMLSPAVDAEPISASSASSASAASAAGASAPQAASATEAPAVSAPASQPVAVKGAPTQAVAAPVEASTGKFSRMAPPIGSDGQPMTPEQAWHIVNTVQVKPEPTSGPATVLISADVVRHLAPATRRAIQQALLIIYSEDPAYLQAYRESTRPLSDNLVGPITLSWLNRFWLDFKMQPVGNLTSASVQALLKFASIVRAHPQWKADLVGADLGKWIDGFDAKEQARYYQIRLAGTDDEIAAMLWLYHLDTDGNRNAGPDPDRALLTIYNYTLDAADFTLLASKSKVIDHLSALQDKVYLNQPLFDAAVLDALKDLGKQAEAYLPEARAVAITTTYQLTQASLAQLRNDARVPTPIIDAVSGLTEEYASQADFNEAILDATADIKTPVDPYVPEIVRAVQSQTTYVLTARALAELASSRRNESVPPVILDMLKGLQGLQYPQLWLFDRAVMARLREGVGACPTGIPGSVADARKVSAEQMQQLSAVLRDPALFAQLEALWRKGACSNVDTLSLPQLMQALYDRFRPSLVATARKKPAFDPNKQVSWDGNGCGCVLDRLDGEVYGFFPFWMAGPKQNVDFSTLSRIGYYGATFDDTGRLVQANYGSSFVDLAQTSASLPGDFVSVAQRHQSNVQWVIQRNDWRSWTRLDKDRKVAVLNRLSDDIVRLLSTGLQNWTAAVSNRLPFGARFAPTNGSGVVLFFDGYPEDPVSVQAFNQFVDQLRSRLRKARAGDRIDVMLRHDRVGHGVYSYANLMQLVTDSDKNAVTDLLARVERDQKRRPNFLVLLDEPTTDSKKALRESVEAGLHGEERMTVLRQIVPVITFDNDNWQQLQDDIVYAQDNFGGIGFWPMPLSAAGAAQKTDPAMPTVDSLVPRAMEGVQACTLTRSISECIADHYQDPPGAQSSAVCKTVCENLYAFRLATKLVLLLLIGCAVAYYASCRWREWMARYHHAPALVVGAVWILLGLALLFCDPFLRWLARGYMIPIFLVLFIIAVIAWYQYQLKARDDQP